MSAAGSRPIGHVPALDGVRGLAILLVLLLHFGEQFDSGLARRDMGRSVYSLILPVSRVGWCGVDLFFVLSGFLITGILYDAKGSARYFVNFYGRRSVRIFPLYYGVLAAVFLAAPALGVGTGVHRSLGRDQAWFWLYGVNVLAALRGSTFPLVHFWTLAVEEHFYLVWPLVVRSLRRGPLMGACVGVSAFALGLRCWLVGRVNPVAVFMLTPCRVDTLALGALLALAVRGSRGSGSVRPWARAGLIVGGSGLVLGRFWDAGPYTPWVQSVGYSLVGLFFLGMVGLSLPGEGKNFVARVFEVRGLRALGKYSYGIYVYHVFVMGLTARALPPPKVVGAVGTSMACVAFVAAGVGLSFAAAWVSWWAYERPFLSLKDRFFRYG